MTLIKYQELSSVLRRAYSLVGEGISVLKVLLTRRLGVSIILSVFASMFKIKNSIEVFAGVNKIF